jgi:hypothetical protein
VIFSTLAQLAVLSLFLISLTLLGGSLREVLKAPAMGRAERLLWDALLGTAAAAVMTGVGGLCGLYRLSFFVPLLLLGPLLGMLRFSRRSARPLPPAENGGAASLPDRVAAAGVGLCALLVFTGALLPETFYDALYYHLGLPSQYLLQGGITTRPAVVHSAFPAYHDTLLGVLLALGDPSLARLFTFVIYLLSGAACSLLGGVLFGTGGAVAAFLLLSTPGVIIMSSMTNVDTAMIWYSAMALAATARALKCGGEERRRWAILAAIPLGMAAGSKYTGLFLVPLPLLALLAAPGGRGKDKLQPAALLAGTALLVASPWYLRNLAVYGNPVYPALEWIFGSSGAGRWAMENLRSDLSPLSFAFGDPAGAWQLALSGKLSLGAGAEVGWGALLVLPATLAAFVSRRELRPFLPGVLLFLVLWALNHSAVRYLYPVFPLLAAAGGWGVTVLSGHRRALRTPAALILALALSANLTAAGKVLAGQFGGKLALQRLAGRITAGEYLNAMLPYHATALWMNAELPSDARVLFLGETRLLYVEREVAFSSAYDRTGLVDRIREKPSAGALLESLAREGIGYILINAAEVRRLNAAYRYMEMTPAETAVLNNLLQQSVRVVSDGNVHLFRLPVP